MLTGFNIRQMQKNYRGKFEVLSKYTHIPKQTKKDSGKNVPIVLNNLVCPKEAPYTRSQPYKSMSLLLPLHSSRFSVPTLSPLLLGSSQLLELGSALCPTACLTEGVISMLYSFKKQIRMHNTLTANK